MLRQLGLGEVTVQAVQRLSVKQVRFRTASRKPQTANFKLEALTQVVDSVLRNQGVQASASDDVETECGTRVLKTVSPAPTRKSLVTLATLVNLAPPTQVLQEMRRVRSDPKYFEQGRPMGSEVHLCPRLPLLSTKSWVVSVPER